MKLKNLIKTIIRKAFTFVDAIIKDNIGVYAAQASFFIIISSVPFVMLLIALVKFIVPSNLNQMSILNMINSFAPSAIVNFLTTIANEIFDKGSSVSVISVTAVTTLWIASKGIMALSQGLTNVYKPEKVPNFFYRRFKSVLYTLVFIAALVLTMVVFGFGSKIEALFISKFPIFSVAIGILLSARVLIFTIILTLCFALFYKFLSKTDGGFKYQLPGALCAAAGWILFSYAYSIYIEYFSNYSYVYGSLTAIVFLMLWLYFCMNIFLYGAEINKIYKERFKKKY